LAHRDEKMKLTRRDIIQTSVAFATGAPLQLIPSRTEAAEFSYKYGNNVPLSHPINIAAQKAADRIKEESSGRLVIDIFPNSQLGGDTDMLSQIRSGALEFYSLSGLVLATLIPTAAISGIGFAFPNYDRVWQAMDGDLGTYVRTQIERAGLIAMERIWDNGYRQITSSSRPIHSPQDLNGFKIRVPISPIWTSLFKSFGASPTPINFSETYSALQTKLVEGQEQPLSIVHIAKLYEVQRYCSLTDHMWDGFWFVANKGAWRRLPKGLQEIVARNIDQAAIDERRQVRWLNETISQDLEAKGMIFNRTETQLFRATLAKSGFYTEWRQRFGLEAWTLLEKYTGELV